MPAGNRFFTDMVRVRDGVRLATDFYLPDGAGPFPGCPRAHPLWPR